MAKKPKKTKSKFAKGWATRRKNAAKLGVSPHQFKAETTHRAGIRTARASVAPRKAPYRAEVPLLAQDNPSALNQELSKALFGDAPGHGEIVGGADAKLADELIALGRKKGGKDMVQDRIAMIRAQARYEGQNETDKANTKRLVDVQQNMADAVVCGFIAEVEAVRKYHGGLPKDLVWSIASFTVLRIVDALNAAGYTSRGRNGSLPSERVLGQRHGSTG